MTVFDPTGNADVDRTGLAFASGTATIRAGAFDPHTRSAAALAGLTEVKETLVGINRTFTPAARTDR